MNLDIRIDISRCKASAVGEEHGITPDDLKKIEPRVEAAHQILQKERAKGQTVAALYFSGIAGRRIVTVSRRTSL